MSKKFTLAIACLLLSTRIFATHAIGAELLYAFNGTNYTVTFNYYRDCAGITAPSTVTVNFVSSSCSMNFSRNFSVGSTPATATVYCPSVGNSCTSPGSHPFIEEFTYIDTVSLPPCNDWKMSVSIAYLPPSLGNVMGGGNLYVEAFLNNSTAINNSPIIATPPPFIIPMNTYQPTSVQAVDAENDSLDYQMIVPEIASGTNVTYMTGYSVTSPMGSGSLSVFDAANEYLGLKSSSSGKFLLSMRVSEYRNGALIGYTTRTWMVIAMSYTGDKNPLAATGTNFNYITHPGQTQTLTMNFDDSTATDSVFVGFQTTNGWTYSTTSTPGLGSGSGTISWTTPSSVNPATTPYFYIFVPVHSNSCPVEGWTINTILVKVLQPNPNDSVWAGDADDDYAVTMYDPLAIAIAYGQTGATRTGASTSWIPQYCAPWPNSFVLSGINMKHADCNGDGTVNSTDLAAVTANYGMSHPRGHNANHKTTGNPDLYFDLSSVTLTPGANISVPIKFGTSGTPMSNIYGLAASIEVSGAVTLTAAPTLSYSSSWIGTTSNTLNFAKAITNNRVDWAYARRDQANVSGNGTIATLNFTVPSTATAGQKMKFHFDMPRVIDKDGNIITTYNALDDSATIVVAGVASVGSPVQHLEIVPNPSNNYASLVVSADQAATLNIKVMDMLGKTIWQQNQAISQGQQSISLPASNMPAGMYMIQVQGEGWQYKQNLKWIKE